MSSPPVNEYDRAAISPRSFQFCDASLEQRFVSDKLNHDKKMAQFLIAVIALTFCVILLLDHMIIKPEYWPYPALVWRAGFITLCLAVFLAIPKLSTVKQLQRTTLVFTVLLFINLQGMVLTYLDHYVLHVFFNVIILIAIYFSTLFSFKLSCVLGIGYGLVGSFVIFYSKAVDTHSLAMIITAYFSANLTGALIASKEHQLKRTFYLSNNQLSTLADKMQTLALKDSLTHLANRRAFYKQFKHYHTLTKLDSTDKLVYFVLVDIDYFKKINDTYGHDVGDEVLIAFSQLLLHGVAEEDAVFRFGGEEFLVILVAKTADDALELVNLMIDRLNRRILSVPKINYAVTASFGVTQLQANDDEKTALSRADTALYNAKNNGRNQLQVNGV